MEAPKDIQREFGPQPLDKMMEVADLSSADLIRTTQDQLTFKMIKKARCGRRLTRNVQLKILRAINQKLEKNYRLDDLFNY